MPAFTVNRNYPYSVPSDPADVPGALQAFAEAVDDDLETRDAVINTRPYVKLRGATTTTVPVATNTLLPFDVEDFDTDSMADLTVSRTTITVQTAGFYWVHARLRVYKNGASVFQPYVILAILQNGGSVAVTRLHTMPVVPDYTDISVSDGVSLAAGDTLTLQLNHNLTTNTNISRFRELTAFKVAT